MTGAPIYYIHTENGEREGPFDLATMLRKIRAGKLSPVAVVSTPEEEFGRPAMALPELSGLFRKENMGGNDPSKPLTAEKRVMSALTTGWRFVGQNPVIFVVASIGVVAAFGAGIALSGIFPWWFCAGVGICLYLMLQSLIMVTVLRLYRGQQLNVLFFRDVLVPGLLPLVLSSVAVGMLGLAGMVVLLLPGLFILAAFAFVPFLVADRKLSLVDAMQASVDICKKAGWEGFGAVLMLVCINLISLFLIVTLPVTLPILSVALAELYEDFAH